MAFKFNVGRAHMSRRLFSLLWRCQNGLTEKDAKEMGLAPFNGATHGTFSEVSLETSAKGTYLLARGEQGEQKFYLEGSGTKNDPFRGQRGSATTAEDILEQMLREETHARGKYLRQDLPEPAKARRGFGRFGGNH